MIVDPQLRNVHQHPARLARNCIDTGHQMDRLTYVIRKRSGTAEPVLSLVSVVNCPQLRISLDLYHTQIGEGDLIQWVAACLPWIGEV